jgi:long-chain acyl-CoA synthetase
MDKTTDSSHMTFPKLLRHNAEEWGREICMRKKDFGIWLEYSWQETYQKVCHFALGLLELGFEKDDKMAIVGDNDPQWCWGQLGAQAVGGIVTGIFSDATPEEIRYILDHSGCTLVLANDQEQVDKVLQIRGDLPSLNRVIYWDEKGLTNYSDPLLMSYEDLLEMGEKRA